MTKPEQIGLIACYWAIVIVAAYLYTHEHIPWWGMLIASIYLIPAVTELYKMIHKR